MSTAVCTACGTEIRWRATRGARLAEIRCKCGGELTAKRSGAYGGRKTYVARLTYIRRNGLDRRTRYFVSEASAKRNREEATPFYESVVLEVKGERGWSEPALVGGGR